MDGSLAAGSSAKQRLVWLDSLRGIAMFLVILGHVKIDPAAEKYIYSFHMPLFFMISGMTYRSGKYAGLASFVKDKAKRLLIPYFSLNLLMFPLWYCNNRILSHSTRRIRDGLLGVLLSNDKIKPLCFAGSTWFLTTLFLVSLLFYLCDRFSGGDRKKLAISVGILGAMGYAGSAIENYPAPWHADTALTAVVFYFLGYLFMQNLPRITTFLSVRRRSLLTVFILFSTGFVLHFFNKQPSMNGNKYGSVSLFYICAVCSSLAWILAVMKLPGNKLFSFIGENTILYLGLHSGFIRSAKIFFPFENGSGWQPVLLAVVLYFLLIPFCLLINRVLPFVAGKFPDRKKEKKQI